MKKTISLTILLCLVACAQSTQTQISSAQIALSFAEKAATDYIRQPFCTATRVTKCVTKQAIKDVALADNIVYAAVTTAQDTQDVDDVTKAKQAFAVLVSLIPNFYATLSNTATQKEISATKDMGTTP